MSSAIKAGDRVEVLNAGTGNAGNAKGVVAAIGEGIVTVRISEDFMINVAPHRIRKIMKPVTVGEFSEFLRSLNPDCEVHFLFGNRIYIPCEKLTKESNSFVVEIKPEDFIEGEKVFDMWNKESN